MTDYQEIHRPQFHFSAMKNWINDPNGLVYFDGIWHLFFQHNAESNTWGPMWWGHALSHDLIHWKQKDHALYPDEMGSIFSGSAIVDHNNSAGFGKNALVLFYTAANINDTKQSFTQCIAYSTDNGVTWTKYKNNPILPVITSQNRDPRVIWHEPSKHWIMALYLESDTFALFKSKNLLSWIKTQELQLESDCECPDFYPLVDNLGNEKWIFSGANGIYFVGSFNGEVFTKESSANLFEHGKNGYASQTWNNSQDGRRIQISWMAGGIYPEMSFNQQLSFPVNLSLKNVDGQTLLYRWPINEIKSLYNKTIEQKECIVSKGNSFDPKTNATIFDMSFTVQKQSSKALYLMIRGHYLSFNWEQSEFSMESSGQHKITGDRQSIKLPNEDKLSVRLLIDKTSIEIFINDGMISGSFCFLPGGYADPVIFLTYSEPSIIHDFALHELKSIWG